MTPQAIAAMSLKMAMPRILARFGYRGVLISNTVILGLLIALFATIGVGTPAWLMVAETFCFGFFSSLQYTSMNTLVYADVTEMCIRDSGRPVPTANYYLAAPGSGCPPLPRFRNPNA